MGGCGAQDGFGADNQQTCSHNTAYIPVLLEFMRFQQNEEALLTLASFMVRIRDKIPEEEFTIVPDGQGGWGWWLEWLTLHPLRCSILFLPDLGVPPHAPVYVAEQASRVSVLN